MRTLVTAVRSFDSKHPLVLPLLFFLLVFVAYAYTTPPDIRAFLR